MKKLIYSFAIIICFVSSCDNKEIDIKEIDYYYIHRDIDLQFWDSLLILHGNNPYLLSMKVLNLLDNNNFDEVENTIKQFDENNTFSETAKGYYHLRIKSLPLALNFFFSALKLDYKKENVWVRIGLAEYYEFIKTDTDSSLKYLLDAFAIDKKNSFTIERIIENYLSIGKIKESERYLEFLTDKNVIAYKTGLLGAIEFQKNNYLNAEKLLEESIKQDNTNNKFLYLLIDAYFLNNKLEKVYNMVSKELQRDPNNANFNYYFGLYYAMMKDYYNSEKYFNKSLKSDPSFDLAFFELLNINIQQKKYDIADSLIASYVKIKGHNFKIDSYKLIIKSLTTKNININIQLNEFYKKYPNTKEIEYLDNLIQLLIN
jgi:tetratricopeptide (TPR) repeat protein